MSSYELVLIISPELVDDEMPDFITKLSELVDKVGGSVDEVNQWGRRKLAYPIKRSTEGNYVLAKVKMKPALTKELEASLRLSGKILRHLLIRSAD
jgi:small subunit ribosomal protein S6